jgi:hypothetical protein
MARDPYPTHEEYIPIAPINRTLHVANYQSVTVGPFAAAKMEKGDGYIFVANEKVLLTERQIAELRKEHQDWQDRDRELGDSFSGIGNDYSSEYEFAEVAALERTEHLRSEAAPLTTNIPEIERDPIVVCLCGSTKFWRDFQRASLRETMAGRIVLSIGAASGTDDEHFGNLKPEQYDAIKEMLDTLHLRKIKMADEILILNVGDYIGQSTTRELRFARECGISVRWLEPSDYRLPGERVG